MDLRQTPPAASEEARLRSDVAKLAADVDTLTKERLTILAENQRLSAQVARERGTADVFARCAEMLNSSLDIEVILRRALDLAVEFMQAERGFIGLRRQSRPIEVTVLHNLDRPTYEADKRISTSIVERVIASGQPLITTDAQVDPRFNAEQSIIAQHIRSIVCVPLKVRDDVIGVVYLDSRVMPGLFSRREPELLLSFANLAGPAIDNARLFAMERARLQAISALEAFRTRILETVAGGIITVDLKRTITTFNAAAERTFGIAASAMLGGPITSFDKYVPGISMLFEPAHDAGEVNNVAVKGMHENGSALALELRVAAIDAENSVVVVNDLTAQHALENSFSRYLAPHVVRSLINDPNSVHLGGERETATILFADIRGFTAMSARMRPEAVVELLNRYLERAVGVIFSRDGLLDKFYGDGVMVVFGPPRARPDDAARAIETAVELQLMVDRISDEIDQNLRISIGLATGTVVAGHIGSLQRMEYTVIGDAVNLASRLQAKAPPGTILCDEATYLASGTNRHAEPFQATIRGREEALRLYRIHLD